MDAEPRRSSVLLLLLALAAGAAVMVLEIAAPRLVAPDVGTSSFTWTVVIATFLGGLALGNAWGGRLADRERRLTLLLLFGASALGTLATLGLHPLAMSLTLSWSHTARVLVAVPVTFLPVACLLGTLPPVIAREVLRRGEEAGWRLGLVSAAGAVGSVAGTFLAGFVLVPAYGLRELFLGCAALLTLAGMVSPTRRATARAPAAPHAEGVVAAVVPRGWTAFAVLAGAAILGFEIAAGRIASDNLGSSLYTWTSVIGVVLLGLALGALMGGRLADRYAPRPLLRWLLLGASFAVLLALWSPAVLGGAEELSRKHDWAWASAALLTTSVAFLFGAFVLGTLSPVIIRAALAAPESDGRVVGGLYAAGTIGAVASTLLVGTLLIPLLGLERFLLVLAFLLAIASGRLGKRQPYAWHALLVLVALAIHGPWPGLREVARDVRLVDDERSLHVEDSRYYRIRVRQVKDRWVRLEEEPELEEIWADPLLEEKPWWEEDRRRLHWEGTMSILQLARLRLLVRTEADRRAVERLRVLMTNEQRLLTLDHLIHGYVDLQDPTWLGYGYERLYADVVEHLRGDDEKLRCLFIGGGAFAFQRRLLALHGFEFRCVTAEIDPRVTATARRWLGLRPDPRHEIVHEDARTYVERPQAQDERFDLVFGDAFNDLAVPFHLTTREFAEALRETMAPDGVYLMNVIDSYTSGLFLGAMLKTLGTVFENVRLLSVAPRVDRSRDTFVIVASDAPLPLASLPPYGNAALGAVLYDPFETEDLVRRAGHLILTDDHAPVETLLAPIVRDQHR